LLVLTHHIRIPGYQWRARCLVDFYNALPAPSVGKREIIQHLRGDGTTGSSERQYFPRPAIS